MDTRVTAENSNKRARMLLKYNLLIFNNVTYTLY